ncbi:MAG: DUF5640 domain-containing protein [Oscillospiraceae bacterium]|nr:DUF5640 domain-containing protein [Oscillospiraceae bacterium]
MRKLFTGVLALLMAASMLLAFTGCGGSNLDLVGTWAWNADSNVVYVFNADGTGHRGGTSQFVDPSWNQSFTWSVNNNDVLLLNFSAADIGNERWDATITDDILNLVLRSDRTQDFSYIRVH